MADIAAAVDAKETKTAATPEKKVVAEEVVEKKIVDAEEADDDSKASENGDGVKESPLKENGSSDDKKEPSSTDNDKEPESTENGDSTDSPAVDACCIKRKSTAISSDVVDGSVAEVGAASPEKKAKLEEKSATPAVATADGENNGGEAEAAA